MSRFRPLGGTVPGLLAARLNGPYELLLEAAESCPAVAISIVDQERGETVYP